METKSSRFLSFTALLISIVGLSAVDGFSPLSVPPNYYWRDYDGEIPSYAVMGGANALGVTTYIGQALGYQGDNYGSIPTEIIPGSKELFLRLNGVVQSNLDMKILCCSVTGLKWVPTTAQNFENDVWNLRLVKGGTEVHILQDNAMTLFVGRIALHDQVIVGKIVTNSTDYERGYSPLFVILNGSESGPYETFEFLAFNP